MSIVIEINSNEVKEHQPIPNVLITPNISPEFWICRVKLTEKQALVVFPKFGMLAIGFKHEEDWNTNLPLSCDADRIYQHIRHNRGDEGITEAMCIEAIKVLQDFCIKKEAP